MGGDFWSILGWRFLSGGMSRDLRVLENVVGDIVERRYRRVLSSGYWGVELSIYVYRRVCTY